MDTNPKPLGSEANDIAPEWLAKFEAAARRPLALRIRYAFIKTYKPVMDDAPFRAFDTTAEVRGEPRFETTGRLGASALAEAASR